MCFPFPGPAGGYDIHRPATYEWPTREMRVLEKLGKVTRLLRSLCAEIEKTNSKHIICEIENGKLKLWWDENKKEG